jgi:hypothetical protein
MSNNNITPEEMAQLEEIQRRVAEKSAQDPELVAAVATAFAAGLQIGAARVKEEAHV